MLIDEQLKQRRNVSKGGVPPMQNIDRNDDYFEFHPEISRHRSKLRVLYHAATCPCGGFGNCPAGVVHCCASKRVFAHIIDCTAGNDCYVPGCQHSRRVWRHYRNCGRNGERCVDANTDSPDDKSCDICSAVPALHDVSTLCNRFRTTTSFFKRATMKTGRDTRNATHSDSITMNINFIKHVTDQNVPTQSHHEKYDRLPVWRKRNLLHAHHKQQWQQQQGHQKQLPLHEKENSSSSTNFTASKKRFSGGSNYRSTYHSFEDSFNRSTSQHRVVSPYSKMYKLSSFDSKTLDRTKYTFLEQFDGIDNVASNPNCRASFGCILPMQLPAHPKDVKQRYGTVLKARSRRPVQHVGSIYKPLS